MAIYYYSIAHNSPEVVTLAEAKAHLKVDFDTDDTLIADLIDAAIDDAENFTCTSIREAKYGIFMDDFNDHTIKNTPVQSITAITYKDALEAEQTLPTTAYELRQIDKYAFALYFIEDAISAIQLSTTQNTPVNIKLTTGYSLGTVPAVIKQAILLTVADFYENREDKIHRMPTRVQSLLRKYRFYY